MSTIPKPPNPWPIAIVSYFVVFAAFIACFIVWALRQREDLVSVNYYEDEVLYQRQIERLRNTAALPSSTSVAFDADAGQILIRLPESPARPVSGRIHLYRPSDASLDRDFPLPKDAGGLQRLDARGLRSGLWKVRVEWSASGKDFYSEQQLIVPPVRG